MLLAFGTDRKLPFNLEWPWKHNIIAQIWNWEPFTNSFLIYDSSLKLKLTQLIANFISKVCTLKNNTNLNPIFCLLKSSKIDSIFSTAFHLIIWVIASTKNFEKIAILKIWQLDFFRGFKTYFGVLPLKWCIFRHERKYFEQ